MKIKHLAATGAAVAVLAVFSGSTAWAATETCTSSARPQMRLRLTTSPGQPPVDREAIEHVVERIWQAEGIEISWVGADEPWKWSDIDAWIHLDRNASGRTLAATQAQGKFIRVSIDSTLASLEEQVARRLQVPAAAASHLVFANAQQLERSLGFTIAHELGHHVLGLTDHATSGLMRPAHELLSSGANDFDAVRLDAKSRSLVQEHLSRVPCAAR